MEPTSAALGAGDAAGRGLSLYVALQLSSVLAPGLVLVTEIGALVLHNRYSQDAWQTVVDASGDIRGLLILLLGSSVLAAAYVTGYVARELAFKILGLAERVSRVPAPTATQIRERLRDNYGESAVQECFRAHPMLERFLATGREPAAVRWHHPGGSHCDGNVYEAFVYAKIWLNRYIPGVFSLGDIEAEINILVSTLLPIGLGAWMCVDLGQLGPAGAVAVGLAGALLCWLVLVSALRLRRSERWEALRCLVEEHAMQLAAARRQAPPEPAPGPGPVPRPASPPGQGS